jgi:hypothetical protein
LRHEPLPQFGSALVIGDSPLLQAVAIADRNRAIQKSLAVDGDAERRADFVLPTIPTPNRRFS